MSEQTDATVTYQVDQIVKFAGYSQELPNDMQPIFEVGQQIKLMEEGDEPNSFKAALVDDPTKQDTVFAEEIAPIEEPKASTKPAVSAKQKKAAAKHGAAKTETKAAAAPAPAPVTEAKTEEAAPVLVPDTQAVRLILESQDALEAAKTLHTQIEENYFTLGGVLSYIRKNKSYQTLKDAQGNELYSGNNGFAQYVEAELETKYRKAMYLIEIYEKFTALGIDEKRLTQVGWSKASQLSRIATEQNFEELLDYAKEHTKQEVEDHVKDSIVQSGGTASAKKTVFTFRLFEDKAAVAKQALSEAGKSIDSEDANEQFDFILTEWLSLRDGNQLTQEQAIGLIERQYGIKLEVATEEETAPAEPVAAAAAA